MDERLRSAWRYAQATRDSQPFDMLAQRVGRLTSQQATDISLVAAEICLLNSWSCDLIYRYLDAQPGDGPPLLTEDEVENSGFPANRSLQHDIDYLVRTFYDRLMPEIVPRNFSPDHPSCNLNNFESFHAAHRLAGCPGVCRNYRHYCSCANYDAAPANEDFFPWWVAGQPLQQPEQFVYRHSDDPLACDCRGSGWVVDVTSEYPHRCELHPVTEHHLHCEDFLDDLSCCIPPLEQNG